MHNTYQAPMVAVNEVFRQHFEHQFCYDFETLAAFLSEAGFINVHKVDYRSGSCPDLLIDRESRRIESLYIEAQKPPGIQV